MAQLDLRNLREYNRRNRITRNWQLYLMLLPVVIYFVVMCYGPMYGVLLGFKDYRVRRGIMGSPWADPLFKHFDRFFSSPYCERVITNTVMLSLQSLIWGFPVPILLALCVNEVRNTKYKKFVQNVTYAPHFLSTVVLVGMIRSFTNTDYGVVNIIIRALGGEGYNWMQRANLFRPLYIGSGMWQNAGWNSIIYIAALSGIDLELHESAMIDGASRWKRIWYINLPGIMPTIVTLLILNSGYIMSVGFEKVFLMQNDLNLSVSDVISTYSYRIGIESAQYEMATAIGLFNSVVNMVLLVMVNAASRRLGDTSLW
ncbi:MAG TPA: ABC transporter permease subunit [Clostridia bacterium]|jgi:putative aldouronate transport system permease protein|nr:ABC transporter permease subunit [Clostridia bacterium]HQA98051.1 ABC transporter permease subunit [Clostridia bacterium]HUM59953.1 ABC transporter permease subunit [Clostridia bacterium]